MLPAQPVKTAAVVHDLSGVGRCALTVVLHVLSAMGVQACPVPTAVLSTHTGGFDGIASVDLTDLMGPYLAHWRRLNMRFDAVYSRLFVVRTGGACSRRCAGKSA